MYDYAVFWEWLSLAARWLHIVTAIAWIGSSFYFIALDLGLTKRDGMPVGVHGEEWQVHGGGFYHIQKYLVAPENLPEHLTWFKWESYVTWLSGFALMAIVYYAGADLYLVDINVLDITALQGIIISIASLTIGWIIYDILCRSPIGQKTNLLMVLLFIMLVAMAWGYTQVFTGRASFVHLGAFTATIMSANVFLIIIPNQKIVVASLKAGQIPDPKYGRIAKQRSLHNNYLTLPIVFLMLSNHYPLAFATPNNWIIASLVFLMGVTIRHWFNTRHARTGNPTWTWIVTVVIFIIIMWLSSVPNILKSAEEQEKIVPAHQKFVENIHFATVSEVISSRCSMCHAQEPVWDGIIVPPKNVVLETDADIAANARQIYFHAGRSTAMPPANITYISAQERQVLVKWYESVTQ